MSDSVKFWVQIMVAVLGGVSAALSQYYTAEDMPEAVRLFMLIGGAVAAVLGSILAKGTFSAIRAVDTDSDGIPDGVDLDGDGDADITLPKKSPPSSTPPAALLLLVAVLSVGLLSGCDMFQIHQYDPMTSAQIQKTIDFETLDFDLADKAMSDLEAPEIVRESLKVRHEAELARLEAWLRAEEAKKAEEK